MEPIPHIVRQRMQAAAQPEVHPDPDLLTAFSEKSLSGKERDQILRHLAVCADCREVLSLAQPESEPEGAVAAAPVPSDLRRRWFHGSLLPWAAVAACVVIVSGAVLLRYPLAKKMTAYSPPAQAPATIAARAEPGTPSLDKLQEPVERDTELKQQLPREQATLELQASNELAARRQEAKEFAKASAGQKKLNAPSKGAAGIGMMAEGRAKAAADAIAAASAPPAPPPPALSAKVTGEELKDLKDKEKDKDEARRDAPQPQPSSTTVQVTAAAPAVQANAEVSTQTSVTESAQPPGANRVAGGTAGGNAVALMRSQDEVQLRKTINIIPPRWTLSADGRTLLRSSDAGKSWQAVPVASNVIFHAVSAVGADVWAGGSAGALYHSSDAGLHWSQIKPEANGAILASDIVAVEFTDVRHGRLTTANHEIWTTSDGGQSWHKQ